MSVRASVSPRSFPTITPREMKTVSGDAEDTEFDGGAGTRIRQVLGGVTPAQLVQESDGAGRIVLEGHSQEPYRSVVVGVGRRDEIGVLVAALQAPGGEEVDHHHVVRAAQIGQVQETVTVQIGEGQVGNRRADDR